jgi:hypothetical protein
LVQVSSEAQPFAGIGVKDFLPQAQQQVQRRLLQKYLSAHESIAHHVFRLCNEQRSCSSSSSNNNRQFRVMSSKGRL